MAYTRNPQWKDHPDTSTPITAAKLENIEQGIADAATVADSAASNLAGKADAAHTHALDDLSDVATAGATSGQVLVYSGSAWTPATVGGGSSTPVDFIDVATEYGTTAAAINSAITQANANYVAGSGRTVCYLEAGLWDLTTNIDPKDGVTIRGAGRGATVLRPTGLNPAIKRVGTDASRLTNFTLEHLTIDGVNQSGTYSYQVKGIYLMYVSACSFRHLEIKNTYATGMGLDYPADHTILHDLHISNPGRGMGATIEGGNGIGILSGARDVEDCVISDCTVTGAANCGFLIERNGGFRGMGYRVADCLADSCGRGGFVEAGSLGAVFEGCQAYRTDEHGFMVGVGDDPAGLSYPASGGGAISGCVSMYNLGDGIRYDGTRGVSSYTHYSITDNSVRGNGGNGVHAYVVGSDIIGLSISGNRCANNGDAAGEAGIAIASSGGAGIFRELVLLHNDCYSNNNTGIKISANVTGGIIGNNHVPTNATQTVASTETGTLTNVSRAGNLHKGTTAPSDTTLVWVDTSGI